MAANTVTETVGLVATWLDSNYWLQIVAGATEVLTQRGLTPICFTLATPSSGEPQAPHRFYDLVNQQCLSGVLIISTASFQNCAEGFLQRLSGLPAVCVGRSVEGAPSLWVQNALGIRLLMKHLTEVCGRRRIAFIRGTEKNMEAEARFRAWEDFCVEHSLPWDARLVEQGDFTESTGEAAALRLLDKNSDQPPDAVVVSNDRMALGVLDAVKSRGLSVPDDISVVGFDDLEAERANPPLTTVRQPVFEMGRRAAETLVALMRKEPVVQAQMFTPELVLRASCRTGQSAVTCDKERLSTGANVFLDCAGPPPRRLMSLLRSFSQAEPRAKQLETAPIQQLADELENAFGDAKARDQSLSASVRDLRAYAVGRLELALSQATSLRELHSVLLAHLQLLGLDSLTVGLVHDESGFAGEARLVVDCTIGNKAPLGQLNSWLPGAQIVAAHARRAHGTLRIVRPLFHEGGACGYLLTGGTLIDNSVLNRLGKALSCATIRLAG